MSYYSDCLEKLKSACYIRCDCEIGYAMEWNGDCFMCEECYEQKSKPEDGDVVEYDKYVVRRIILESLKPIATIKVFLSRILKTKNDVLLYDMDLLDVIYDDLQLQKVRIGDYKLFNL